MQGGGNARKQRTPQSIDQAAAPSYRRPEKDLVEALPKSAMETKVRPSAQPDGIVLLCRVSKPGGLASLYAHRLEEGRAYPLEVSGPVQKRKKEKGRKKRHTHRTATKPD